MKLVELELLQPDQCLRCSLTESIKFIHCASDEADSNQTLQMCKLIRVYAGHNISWSFLVWRVLYSNKLTDLGLHCSHDIMPLFSRVVTLRMMIMIWFLHPFQHYLK